MRFLVTNDDGIYAPGIRALAETLTKYGEVVVVAPNQERSGVGHAITVNRPLRINKAALFPFIKESYIVDGTPADCIKIAIEALNVDVDIIVSGINIGANLGTDVFYSGTVSAAIEGIFQGIPSIAVSLCTNPYDTDIFLDTATYYLTHLLFELETPLPKHGLLNVNIPGIPQEQVRGIKATKLGFRKFENEFEQRLDPRGKPYYWMKGIPLKPVFDKDDDHLAVEHNYVSVTPIKFDLTDYELLKKLKKDFE
ncbi:MAG: 5'/3'-nucleotidase SurE [Firmicutes bacterium]|nr:5'/3'-nucleotidase SurE [Bacillota bacterium]